MESSLEELVDLVPDLTDDLLNTVDQPLQLAKDAKGNAYLLCDYNRDGDSYRSPWTNEYDPPLDDGVLPSQKLRTMESLANDIFDGYREMYYEGGAVSVYFWDLDEPAFAACVLFKKGAPKLACPAHPFRYPLPPPSVPSLARPIPPDCLCRRGDEDQGADCRKLGRDTRSRGQAFWQEGRLQADNHNYAACCSGPYCQEGQ